MSIRVKALLAVVALAACGYLYATEPTEATPVTIEPGPYCPVGQAYPSGIRPEQGCQPYECPEGSHAQDSMPECVPDQPVAQPPRPPACPAGSQQSNVSESGGIECVCPGGLPATVVNADGTVENPDVCLGPATTTPPVGDPTEPVPFDDGDVDYPLVPPATGGPVAADPGFTG